MKICHVYKYLKELETIEKFIIIYNNHNDNINIL